MRFHGISGQGGIERGGGEVDEEDKKRTNEKKDK